MSRISTPTTTLSSPIFEPLRLHKDPAGRAVPVATINWEFPMLQVPPRPVSQWRVGLFRCCDDNLPTCSIAFFCPCISLPQLFARMGAPRYGGMVLVIAWVWLAMAAASMLFVLPTTREREDGEFTHERRLPGLVLPVAVLWGGHALAVAVIRRNIRSTFDIPATECSDCAAACCCTPCAIAQAMAHLQIHHHGNATLHRPDVLPAFLEK